MQLNATIEPGLATSWLVSGGVSDIPVASSQGDNVDDVLANLAEVLEILQLPDTLPCWARTSP